MRLHSTDLGPDDGVSGLIEYVSVTGILMLLFVIMMLSVNSTIMEGPANQLRYAAFTDIGNGVSTRIVDVYVIAPTNGTIVTQFDIPDDVAQQEYFVEIGSTVGSSDQVVEVSRNTVKSSISLAGIGSTKGVKGNTTGKGINRISYNSEGY
ncbi:MAG: hypothetical protein A4E35_01249 [Methanoregula sp. PtaU1.Bin051]|nr:MAG: hypothetical protein A4E35_01249 [Methanoregula sp. PtaU1.Bin051]